jgi:hypothetical protein
MPRIPHPVTLTQAVTRTRGGRFLIILGVAIASLHAKGWIDAVPNQDGMPRLDCDKVAGVTITTVDPHQQLPCRPTTTAP